MEHAEVNERYSVEVYSLRSSIVELYLYNGPNHALKTL